AAVELGHAVEIECDVQEVVRFAREQLDHSVNRAAHFGRRRRFRHITVALQNAPAGFFLAAHRQLHAGDAALAPDDAAGSDRAVEDRKMLFGHGSLLNSLLPVVSLMLTLNLGLEIVAIHPKPERICGINSRIRTGKRIYPRFRPWAWAGFREIMTAPSCSDS